MWIDVKDRLPEDNEPVFVWGIWEGEINGADDKPSRATAIREKRSHSKAEWIVQGTDGYAAWMRNVTHWQPLPPPPVEDSKEAGK